MKLCVHRGTHQIGGTCVEVDQDGSRIVLDLGLPLDLDDQESVPLPSVAGLASPDPSLLAVILSHGHRDHWGLLPKTRKDLPVVMGRDAERIMTAASPFIPGGFAPTASAHLEDRKLLQLGPFSILPHLVDHSGFDAYALEVAAGGQRLFYSGDLRAHGRKGRLFERLVAQPPTGVDVMLMEGTSLGRLAAGDRFPSEREIENTFVERFKSTHGIALVACSAQNIDRVVTVYRAAKRSGRTLVMDAYAAQVLKATGHDSIPKPVQGWSNVAVYIPQAQRMHLKRQGIASLVDSLRPFRVWPEELPNLAPQAVMIFRGWMLKDLERVGALQDARVFWSQWDGYLKEGAGTRLKNDLEARGIPLEVIHTSGHASPDDLKRLAAAVAPRRLIPIHTADRDRFPGLFKNVTLVDDGHWIEV